jgi:hypothetical protein
MEFDLHAAHGKEHAGIKHNQWNGLDEIKHSHSHVYGVIVDRLLLLIGRGKNYHTKTCSMN